MEEEIGATAPIFLNIYIFKGGEKMLELDKDLKEEQGKDLRERFIDVIKNYMSEAYALGKMSKDDC